MKSIHRRILVSTRFVTTFTYIFSELNRDEFDFPLILGQQGQLSRFPMSLNVITTYNT